LEQLVLSIGEDEKANNYFILGIFSLLDALLDQDIEHTTEFISLPDLGRAGLMNETGEASQRPVEFNTCA